MAAAGQQQQIGKFQRRIGQARGQGVAFKVVDGDQGLVRGHGQRLGTDQPDHHPADETRPGGGGDSVHIGQGEAAIRQCGGDQRGKPLDMGARGDFRHDAAIGAMGLVLRGDMLRKDQTNLENRPRKPVMPTSRPKTRPAGCAMPNAKFACLNQSLSLNEIAR